MRTVGLTFPETENKTKPEEKAEEMPDNVSEKPEKKSHGKQ